MTTVLRLSSIVLALTISLSSLSARTLEFQSSQVTSASIAVSPDDKTLVFTMLGHLFRLASSGGMAEQLTFGPYYDDDPVFSPDGSRLAFASDRDGNDSNIFIMTIGDRRITQLTHDQSADRPVWSPNGDLIAYRRHGQWVPDKIGLWPSSVIRTSIDGGASEIVSGAVRAIGDVFYLPGGELAWSVFERGRDWSDDTTHIEILSSQGTVSALRSFMGYADSVAPSPSGDGLYCHRYIGFLQPSMTKDDLIFAPTPSGAVREILATSTPNRFAISKDGKNLYLGDQGRLWNVTIPTGEKHKVAFQSQIKLVSCPINT